MTREEMTRRVLMTFEGSMSKAGDIVESYLGRKLFTDEGYDLSNKLGMAISDALEEFEFVEIEEEPIPDIDKTEGMAEWARAHKGDRYKRPKGTVVYTVTGELGQYRHGMIRGYSGPLVNRSSDDKEVPMAITELESMNRER